MLWRRASPGRRRLRFPARGLRESTALGAAGHTRGRGAWLRHPGRRRLIQYVDMASEDRARRSPRIRSVSSFLGFGVFFKMYLRRSARRGTAGPGEERGAWVWKCAGPNERAKGVLPPRSRSAQLTGFVEWPSAGGAATLPHGAVKKRAGARDPSPRGLSLASASSVPPESRMSKGPAGVSGLGPGALGAGEVASGGCDDGAPRRRSPGLHGRLRARGHASGGAGTR